MVPDEDQLLDSQIQPDSQTQEDKKQEPERKAYPIPLEHIQEGRIGWD